MKIINQIRNGEYTEVSSERYSKGIFVGLIADAYAIGIINNKINTSNHAVTPARLRNRNAAIVKPKLRSIK